MHLAEVEIARAKRDFSSFCVVLTDIDKFKAVNETDGHAAGDDVLRQFSIILNAMFRQVELVGRLGGEEFALMLNHTSSETCIILIAQCRV